jgi:UDP-N-acetylmuramate dehydrogenase
MEVHKDYNIKDHTFFKIDSIVKTYVETDKIDSIRHLMMNSDKYVIIGEGSNVYFNKAYDGTVIKNKFSFINRYDAYDQNKGSLDEDYGYFVVGSGTILMDLITHIADLGYDLSSMAGIPGTVGGAIYGNAGAYGVEMKDVCECVYVMDDNGETQKYDNEQMKFDYRHSALKENKLFAISCILKIGRCRDIDIIKEKINNIIKIREGKLPPKELSCAGSFFKNIKLGKSKLPIAKLLDEIGVKGMSSGDICVYENHSNIIINKGNGTADDVEALITRISEIIFTKFGIVLEVEVQHIK